MFDMNFDIALNLKIEKKKFLSFQFESVAVDKEAGERIQSIC